MGLQRLCSQCPSRSTPKSPTAFTISTIEKEIDGRLEHKARRGSSHRRRDTKKKVHFAFDFSNSTRSSSVLSTKNGVKSSTCFAARRLVVTVGRKSSLPSSSYKAIESPSPMLPLRRHALRCCSHCSRIAWLIALLFDNLGPLYQSSTESIPPETRRHVRRHRSSNICRTDDKSKST